MSVKSATLKRLLKERQILESSPCSEFCVEMLSDNALEWHFTMQGPSGTPYEKGYYHGRILIPAEYPFKPPDVVLLTPNGRFELDKRICLSISSYHPENWHPTWGIATVIHALREFMATPGNNAIGAIEYPKSVRESLAEKSIHFCCSGCGCRVLDIREKLLTNAPSTDADKKKQMEPQTPVTAPQSPPGAVADPSGTGVDRDSLPPCELPTTTQGPEHGANIDASPLRDAEEPVRGAEQFPEVAAAAEPVAQPPVVAAVRPVTAPHQRLVELRGGEVIVNLSITTLDRAINVLLGIIAIILFKKAFYDYWSLIVTHVEVLLGNHD